MKRCACLLGPALVSFLSVTGCEAPDTPPSRATPEASPAEPSAHDAHVGASNDTRESHPDASNNAPDELDAGPPEAPRPAQQTTSSDAAADPDSDAGDGSMPPAGSGAPHDARAQGAVPADAREAPSRVGVTAAYAVLTRGEVSAADAVLGDLDERVRAQPTDGYATFYSAAFRLWKLAEGTNSLGDLLSAVSIPEEMIARFERAEELMPNDFRVPGFFGLVLLDAGILSGDQTMIGRGQRTLERAIAMNPAYGYFLRATATSGLATDDPLYATTIGDMEALAKACRWPPGDDQVTYRYPGPGDDLGSRVCSNEGIVPHVWEGTLISFGDVALKSGWAPARVRAIYRSVQASPSYAAWPFAELLERRLREVETNAAAFSDANPFNDPVVWGSQGHICAGCHQK